MNVVLICRETLLRVRRSPQVLNAVVELESEIQRYVLKAMHGYQRGSESAGPFL